MTLHDDDITPIDKVSGAVAVISYEHHEIHDGSHFYVQHTGTFASGDHCDLLLTPPAGTYPHVIESVAASGAATMLLYKAPTTSGGTAVTPINRNQASAKTADTVVVHSPTVTDVGTLMQSRPISGSKIGSGEGRDDNEWILAPGQKYLLRATSGESGCVITVSADWYEK